MYDKVDSAVQMFSNASRKVYGDYAYASGFLGSLATRLIANLPEKQRAAELKFILDTVELLQKQTKA